MRHNARVQRPQSDPGEIVHAVLPDYPSQGALGFADPRTAKWLTDDVLSVIYKRRATSLDSWFTNVQITRLTLCRHKNWKGVCRDCEYRLKETLEYVVAHAQKPSAAAFGTRTGGLRKRPGGENL